MTLHFDTVKNWVFPVIHQEHTEKDTILYALSLSCGMEQGQPEDLSFVYEKNLQAIPTLVNNLCHPGFWISDPRTGIDASRAVHARHKVTLHSSVPVAGKTRAQTKVLDMTDRGAGKGAMLVFGRDIYDELTGQLLASIEQSTLCRGDGGYSGTVAVQRAAEEPGAALTAVAQEYVVDYLATPQAALLYRLGADPNPLHVDPAVATAAGFSKPIMHGLCTFGMAARSAIETLCAYRANRLKSIDMRFLSPAFPGEKIRFQWRATKSEASYMTLAVDRGLVPVASGTVSFSS